MKRFATILIVVVSRYCAAQSLQWHEVESFPGIARDDGVVAMVGNTAFAGSGLCEGWVLCNDFYGFDLASVSWRKISSLPDSARVQYAHTFTTQSGFFLFGGEDLTGVSRQVYYYDMISDNWSLKTPKPGKGLKGSSTMQFGDRVVFSGGVNDLANTFNTEVWEYRISTDTWTQKNGFPFAPLFRAGADVLNNTGYLVCGLDSALKHRKEMYRYIPGSDNWEQLNEVPAGEGRAYVAFRAGDRRLILFGGNTADNTYLNDTWFYNDSTDTWAQGPSLPGGGRRGDMAGFYKDRFFYTCGLGTGEQRLKETWWLDMPLALNEGSQDRFELKLSSSDKWLKLVSDHEYFSYSVTSPGGLNLISGFSENGTAEFYYGGFSEGLYIIQLTPRGGGRPLSRKIVLH